MRSIYLPDSGDALAELGEFDETFSPYGWEDVDLCLQAQKSGYKTLYVPTAVAYYKGDKAGRGIKSRFPPHFIYQ